jgi:hypothetical protein
MCVLPEDDLLGEGQNILNFNVLIVKLYYNLVHFVGVALWKPAYISVEFSD